jgi:hypothetical protein
MSVSLTHDATKGQPKLVLPRHRAALPLVRDLVVHKKILTLPARCLSVLEENKLAATGCKKATCHRQWAVSGDGSILDRSLRGKTQLK